MNQCVKCTISQLGVALLAAGALVASSYVLKTYEMSAPARLGVALSPAPFYVLLIWVMVRGVRMLDELRRRIMLESLAIGFAGGWLLLLLYNRLEVANIGLPPMEMDWVLFLFIMIWVAGYGYATRRY